MTDQGLELDEATNQTVTEEPNTNIIDEAIEYNITDVEFITEVDVTTISRNEDSIRIDHTDIILPVSFLALFFAIVCFLLFLCKEYKSEREDRRQKRAEDMGTSVRPVNIPTTRLIYYYVTAN